MLIWEVGYHVRPMGGSILCILKIEKKQQLLNLFLGVYISLILKATPFYR
jgi:hypothetical protein